MGKSQQIEPSQCAHQCSSSSILERRRASEYYGRSHEITGEYGGWLDYSGARLNWRKEEFAKHFPNEKTYRHSLPEEAEALSTAA